MHQFMEKMCAYGADIARARERFLEDDALYETCVCSFVEDDAFVGLAQAMSRTDYAAAFEYAHALKGVAANLDLGPLLRPICALVDALREQKHGTVASLYTDVTQAQQTLREAVESV